MIRIVFVDDEARVLQSMQRALDSMRADWSMVFVASGAAAQEELAKTPADVIVSDAGMSYMDGWQLLREIKICHPQMARLILSGPADPSSIMRSVGVAHQYLAKPCESAALKAAISQTQRLRRLLSSKWLQQFVSSDDALFRAPKVFQDILACLQQPTASVAEATQIIGRDAAMTANLIRLANSAFFRSRQPVTTATRAIACLGLDTLGALVLGHSLFKSGIATGMTGRSLEGLWQHSLDTAVAARTVAVCEKLSPARAEEAFLAGMLHDVGKMLSATRLTAATAVSPSVEEAAVQMKAHQAEAGAYLLGLWGFPACIVEAVESYHSPSQKRADGLNLPRLVHIADRLAHQRHAECSGQPFKRCLQPELLETLGLEHRWADWLAALDSLDFAMTAA